MATTTSTILGNRIVKWLLSGAAFAAVLASAGCSSLRKAQPAAAAPPVTSVATREPLDDTEAFAPPPAPPQVNIFGELDGVVARGPVKPIGAEGLPQHTLADERLD